MLQFVNFAISFAVVTLLFALIFKILPDVDIQWRDVWVGAAFTALLFTIGKLLIGLYLGNSGVTSTYGAAGSLVVILLWVYYSAQILLFGAEFTQVYARRYGSQIRPADDAIALTREAQVEQGIPYTKWEGTDEQEVVVVAAPPLQVTKPLPMDPQPGTSDAWDKENRPVGGAFVGLGAALVSFAVGLAVGSKRDSDENK